MPAQLKAWLGIITLFIPAYVTGRATVYEWRCTNGAPEIVKQLVEPDAQGFQSNLWYEIRPGDNP